MKLIPEDEHLEYEGSQHINRETFLRHHSQEEWDAFMEWMGGQTVMMVPGDPTGGYYIRDYRKWASGKKEGPFDWD